MPPILPALVYNDRTRVSGELLLYYNLQKAFKYGSVGLTAPDTGQYQAEFTCAGSSTPPTTGVAVVRAKTPILGTDIGVTVQGASATIKAFSAPGQSVELSGFIGSPLTAAQISVAGGNAGDSFDIIILPSPDNDILICYDQGFTIETGEEFRAIPRKFKAVDHYVRQRATNSITLNDLYISNREGVASLRGRDITLIGRLYPDGGGVPMEIIYFTDVRLNVPKDFPAEANDSVTLSATGAFGDELIFSPEPI